MGSLRDREVACSASDRQDSNSEYCVWREVSSHLSLLLQEFLMAQFSTYVHKCGAKPHSLHFRFMSAGSPRSLHFGQHWFIAGSTSHTKNNNTEPVLLILFSLTALPAKCHDVGPMLTLCWATVFDAGPALIQHRSWYLLRHAQTNET